MADETTETTTDAASTLTPAETSGVLDLRPPQESVRAELCRLGLEFSSADGTTESWRDYSRGVLATFDDTGTSVTLTDVKTNLGRTLTLDELKAVTRIDTMTAAD
ncbi:hypothetical protein NE692_03585 [Bifidobacterium adolescentis]|uniref:Uncharacterized protein n=1 Tax=Bifidobacterium adolescentis TaxID=1680 RepID=A0AAW5JST1_BIFAD|nr:hypothetical protein [Bifidobacterium adolescentis]MCQ4792545.1 hypothetical protein [Bifidobacterium adolescentis]